MNKVQHVKWCMNQTKLTSEISCPTDSCQAQLVRHWPEDPEVLVSIPTGVNFWWNYFALPCVKICQIIWQKRLSWKTQLWSFTYCRNTRLVIQMLSQGLVTIQRSAPCPEFPATRLTAAATRISAMEVPCTNLGLWWPPWALSSQSLNSSCKDGKTSTQSVRQSADD